MSEAVVIAEKMLYKKQLFGAISYGGAIIKISDGKSIKIVSNNDKNITLQILESGIGKEIKTQSWVKAKIIKEKVIVEKPIKEETLIQFTENKEQTLF